MQVRGQAHRVLQPGEPRNVREACALVPRPASEHDPYVRILPTRVTGRRITGPKGPHDRDIRQ